MLPSDAQHNTNEREVSWGNDTKNNRETETNTQRNTQRHTQRNTHATPNATPNTTPNATIGSAQAPSEAGLYGASRRRDAKTLKMTFSNELNDSELIRTHIRLARQHNRAILSRLHSNEPAFLHHLEILFRYTTQKIQLISDHPTFGTTHSRIVGFSPECSGPFFPKLTAHF
jgi:hypothetical protein